MVGSQREGSRGAVGRLASLLNDMEMDQGPKCRRVERHAGKGFRCHRVERHAGEGSQRRLVQGHTGRGKPTKGKGTPKPLCGKTCRRRETQAVVSKDGKPEGNPTPTCRKTCRRRAVNTDVSKDTNVDKAQRLRVERHEDGGINTQREGEGMSTPTCQKTRRWTDPNTFVSNDSMTRPGSRAGPGSSALIFFFLSSYAQ
jgi:hypothetical protein